MYAADERDELNRNPRRQQIHLDIRMIEDNVDKLKRKIEDESNVLNSLRHTAEAQNSIRTLQEQCEKDFDSIEESIRDESYCFSKFGIAAPSTLPKENDTDGELLVKAIEDMSVATRKKYDALDGDLNRLKEVILNNQKTSAEKSALLSGNQKSLGTVKSKLSTLSTSVSDVQTIVEQLRRHEAEQGASLTTSEETPRELLRHIDKRLAEIEEDAPVLNESKIAKKIRLRVARMVCHDSTISPCRKCAFVFSFFLPSSTSGNCRC